MVPSVKTGGSELHKAAAAGDGERVAELVDVETGSAMVDPTKADGTTPLITAAMLGHTDVVSILIEQGADIEKVWFTSHYAASAAVVCVCVGGGGWWWRFGVVSLPLCSRSLLANFPSTSNTRIARLA
jgi:ankyrin repeat protein